MISDPITVETGVSTTRNDDRIGLGDAEPAIEAAHGLFEQRIAIDEQVSVYPRRSKDGLEARRRMAIASARSLGVEDEVSVIRADEQQRWTALTKLKDRRFVDIYKATGRVDPHADDGWFWWAETSAWLPSDRIGLSYYWDTPAGGYRFTGQMERDDGDLYKTELGVVARFGIGSNRLPPAGRYVSAPTGTFAGRIEGANGVNGPLSFADNWTKCWLGLVQTLRDPYGAIIAEAVSVPPALIFLESDGDLAVVDLPGQFSFPQITVDLVSGVALTAELTVKLGFQLEGESLFRFGDLGGLIPALILTPQWKLMRA